MSLVRSDTINAISQTMGIGDLQTSAAAHLAQDVEYRLRETIQVWLCVRCQALHDLALSFSQDACKFMKHSNRQQLTTADIDAALRLRNMEVELPATDTTCVVTFPVHVRCAGTLWLLVARPAKLPQGCAGK